MPTERLSMRRIRGFFLHLKYAQGMRDRAAAVSPGPGSRGCVTGLLPCLLDLAAGDACPGCCGVPWTWQGNSRELSGAV